MGVALPRPFQCPGMLDKIFKKVVKINIINWISQHQSIDNSLLISSLKMFSLIIPKLAKNVCPNTKYGHACLIWVKTLTQIKLF